MSKAKNFLNFISSPKEIYNILDKYGYRDGNALIKAVINKKYAEQKDHKIILTKLGKMRLNELETKDESAFVEIQPQPVEQIEEPVENKNNSSWILGIVGLLGFIFSVWKISSSKSFTPYGIIGFIFLISLILSIVLLVKKN